MHVTYLCFCCNALLSIKEGNIYIEMHKLDHLYMTTSSSADFSYEVIYQLLGDFSKEKRNHLKYLMAHKYLFYRQYSKVAL